MDAYRNIDDGESTKSRPRVIRRSCDPCRARKVGCDRASPCSNCISTRLNCTHSAVASSATTPKQRVLVSAKYEQKVDDIAEGINGIKILLGQLITAPDATRLESRSIEPDVTHISAEHPVQNRAISPTDTKCSSWNHSAHTIDLIRNVIKDERIRGDKPETSEVISSLKTLVRALENPAPTQDLFLTARRSSKQYDKPLLPPLDAALDTLRWAKDHEYFCRIAWISQILPLEMFGNICSKIYFALEDYNQIDLIIANGYLAYIFSERVTVSGPQEHGEYGRLCRKNLHQALAQLPLLLPASLKAIAALAFGAFNAIEDSNTTTAWTFVSTAANMCQTLNYHSFHPGEAQPSSIQATQQSLFWTIYRLDKSLALRLGRFSTIRDSDIYLTSREDESRSSKVARIQGKVYEELYSQVGLSRQDSERSQSAAALASQLQKLIVETHVEISSMGPSTDREVDPVRTVYLQFDLVCQSSLLSQIIRAIPDTDESLNDASDACVAVARETLNLHEQCIKIVYGHDNSPSIVTKYFSWAILHAPFVPFSILFSRAVQFCDLAELVRLERFVTSLQLDQIPSEPTAHVTHPYLLYKLLCDAARLYIEARSFSASANPTLAEPSLADFDYAQFETMSGLAGLDGELSQASVLSDWYYDNQQMLRVLDDHATFEF